MLRVLLISCLVFLGLSQAAVRVAVLPFYGDSSLPAQQKEFLSGELVTELTKVGSFVVLERSRMEEIFKEQGLQSSGVCDSSSCQSRMGKLLGVDFLIIPSISKFDQDYSFRMDLVNVSTGSIDRALSYRKPGLLGDIYRDILFKAAHELAGIKINETAVQKKKWVTPLSLSISIVGIGAGIMGILQNNILQNEREIYEQSQFVDQKQADQQWNKVTNAEWKRNLLYGVSSGLLATGITIYFVF